MRRGIAISFIVMLTILLVFGIWLAKLIWFKPFNIEHFFKRAYIELIWNDPEVLSHTGILESYPFLGYRTELTDMSPKSTLHLAKVGRRNLEILESYNRDEIPEGCGVSYDVLHWFLETGVAGEPFLFHDYPVTQLTGPHIEMPMFLTNIHRVKSKNEIEDYLCHLKQLDEKFGSLIDALEERKKIGVIAPTYILKQAILFCDNFTEPPAKETEFYTWFETKLNGLDLIEPNLKQKYLNDCETTIQEEIYPAYRRLSRYLFQLQRSSTSVAGVWQLPDGEAYYKYCLLQHTGTNVDPEILYKLGRLEMGRLQGELTTLLQEVGYDASENLAKTLLSFAENDTLTFSEDEIGRAYCLQYFRDRINTVNKVLPEYFNHFPSTKHEVIEVPNYRASSSGMAFYVSPRGVPLSNGKTYVNTWKANSLTHYSATTYAYHEGIPGHHLQKGIQVELTGLPAFRRFIPVTVFTEGWAMYAEQLGHEMTGTQDSWDKIGMLQSDLFRTVRMVTDVGIHHKKWLRDQAISFMMENTGMTEKQVTQEVDRYVIWPGQACAYKVGLMKFLELREIAENQLGDAFDIREFHDVLIEQGAMPMEIVEKRVMNYIETTLKTKR